MANGGWKEPLVQIERDVRRERHRGGCMEYIAISVVVLAAMVCGVGMVWPTTTSKSDDGKTTTVSGLSESTKSVCQTLFTAIVGAAIGFAFKQNQRPMPEVPHPPSR
jgi:hypothetical protein